MLDETYRILVADDDPPILELLGEYLSTRGHQVKLVPNGELALEALRREAFDVLVTDMKMPGEDGLSLVRHIRDNNLPVATIMMTGYGTIESAVNAMRSGAHNYLLKPFRLREVHDSVAEAVAERRQEEGSLRLHHLLDLQAATERLTDCSELDAFYRFVCEKAALETQAKGALLSFFEPAEQRWVTYATSGPPEIFAGMDLETLADAAQSGTQPLLDPSCWFEGPRELLVAPIRAASEPGPPLTIGLLATVEASTSQPNPERSLQAYGGVVGMCVANQLLLNKASGKTDLGGPTDRAWLNNMEEEILRCSASLALQEPEAKAISWALRLRANEGFRLRDLVEGAAIDVVTMGGGGLPMSTLQNLEPMLHSLDERIDGYGTPKKSRDEPTHTRLASAYSYWNWLTRTRAYAPRLNPKEAATKLQSRAPSHYGQEAVDAILQTLGQDS